MALSRLVLSVLATAATVGATRDVAVQAAQLKNTGDVEAVSDLLGRILPTATSHFKLDIDENACGNSHEGKSHCYHMNPLSTLC